MSKLSWFGVVFSGVLLGCGAAAAQQAVPAVPAVVEWQSVVAGQIQAFRDHDADAALKFAGDEFHKAYANPQAFYVATMSSGYEPIMKSHSQTFGPYKVLTPDMVLQEVTLVARDSTVYEAIYQVARETGGWRIHGVALLKTTAIAI